MPQTISPEELETTLRVRVPFELMERLDARALEGHRTRSQQARLILSGWLDYQDHLDAQEGAPPPPPRKRGKRR